MLDEMNIADSTKETYMSYFKSLFSWAGQKTEIGNRWYNLNSPEKYLELADDELQLMLERFLDYLKKRVKNNEISPNTVPKLFKPYKLILDANYREHAVKWKPISIKYPPMEKRSGYKPWRTTQIEEMLGKCNKYKKEAAIMFQASTGSRVGVHDHPLLMKHMIKMQVEGLDYHCYAILIYAETDETVEEKDQRILNDDVDENDYSFFVFLIPEAAKILDKYHKHRQEKFGEVFTPETPIFGAMDKHRFAANDAFYQMSGNAFRKMMQYVVDKTNIKRTKKRNRYDIMIDHGFRKRFNTILKIDKEVNSNIAEKLMQHKKGLDGTYLTPTRQECFAEFSKAILELTIDPRERLRIDNQQKDAEISELQQVKMENKIVNNKVDRMQLQLMELASKQISSTMITPDPEKVKKVLQYMEDNGLMTDDIKKLSNN